MLTLPDGLSPEVHPLAWLVGPWRGFGMLGYPGIPETPFVHDLVVDHDGGPYLRAVSTLWVASTSPGTEIHQGLTGAEGVARLERGVQWSTATEYWRPLGEVSAAGAGEGGSAGASESREVRATELEVVVADPAGVATLFLGAVRGPRIDLTSDAVLRSSTAAERAGATRMYGLVQGDLLWAEDLAAFGHELQSYASGRLTRMEES